MVHTASIQYREDIMSGSFQGNGRTCEGYLAVSESGSRLGAISFIVDHAAVTSDRIGTVGFCMGRELSLITACANQAFFNDSRPDVYDTDAAGKAWKLVRNFFRENVG